MVIIDGMEKSLENTNNKKFEMVIICDIGIIVINANIEILLMFLYILVGNITA